ncbi:nitroreductase family protein [Chitinimonas naiadis]
MIPSPDMLNTLDAIRSRRSVRAYNKTPPDQSTLQWLMDAAVLAPTALHGEPWSFLIIQSPALLKRLSTISKQQVIAETPTSGPERRHLLELFGQPDFNIFYNAPTLIVICSVRQGPFVEADCWLAAENLMLAAAAIGLGSCVIGSAVAGLNSPVMKAELGIPADHTAVAPIIVGTPLSQSEPMPRKAPHILGWL